eukprot:10478977-Alexandrium_andersonii.AAC.1
MAAPTSALRVAAQVGGARGYTVLADIYSAGCILYCVWSLDCFILGLSLIHISEPTRLALI